MKVKKKGFTLIELIIVIIIIGILAAIAAPMMSGNVARARRSEAVAAMGMIRTAERLYYVAHGHYAEVSLGMGWGWGINGELNEYIRESDLNGRYFISNCYIVRDATATDFTIWCMPDAAPNPGLVNAGGTIYMNANGRITNY